MVTVELRESFSVEEVLSVTMTNYLRDRETGKTQIDNLGEVRERAFQVFLKRMLSLAHEPKFDVSLIGASDMEELRKIPGALLHSTGGLRVKPIMP